MNAPQLLRHPPPLDLIIEGHLRGLHLVKFKISDLMAEPSLPSLPIFRNRSAGLAQIRHQVFACWWFVLDRDGQPQAR